MRGERRMTTKRSYFLLAGALSVFLFLALYTRGQRGVPVSRADVFSPGGVYSSESTPGGLRPFVSFKLPEGVGSSKKERDFMVSRVPELPAFLRACTDCSLFHRLYMVDEKQARLVVPDTFSAKVKNMFKSYPGGSDSLHFVEHQTLVTIRNKITHDHSLFNRIRRYRPGYRETLTDEENARLAKDIEQSRGDGCDFCHPERTAEDLFGRVKGEYCYVAANVAKYEKWHSLLIAKEHNPLKFTLPAVMDYLEVAHKWFGMVHKTDPAAVAPHMMWDSTGRASASQMHQHMQLSINTHYYTKAEILREQAGRYGMGYGANLYADMAAVHDQLGLAIRRGQAVLLVHLTPVKEREVIVVGNSKSTEFAELLYAALQGLIEGSGTRSFSASIVFEHIENHTMMPAVARIIDRGAPGDVRNDVGAMEFYGSNNVGMDPFELAKKLRAHYSKLFSN
eukprot:TRINITY_DN25693_c0_g1_i2.p1 TRINITY_DN25693_c0_g1~~TRINITY_DN25693_c0_g1_i2.p1  ORF type:complete len:451 (+),score=162.62 TRINITY_DN25693_c0_g1_i2:44-1396(+)